MISLKILFCQRSGLGFIVLADRYIYTLMARDMVRGMNSAWLKNHYGIAVEARTPFLPVRSKLEELVQRNLAKIVTPDYFKSGMDLGLSRDVFDKLPEIPDTMRMAFRQ